MTSYLNPGSRVHREREALRISRALRNREYTSSRALADIA